MKQDKSGSLIKVTPVECTCGQFNPNMFRAQDMNMAMYVECPSCGRSTWAPTRRQAVNAWNKGRDGDCSDEPTPPNFITLLEGAARAQRTAQWAFGVIRAHESLSPHACVNDPSYGADDCVFCQELAKLAQLAYPDSGVTSYERKDSQEA